MVGLINSWARKADKFGRIKITRYRMKKLSMKNSFFTSICNESITLNTEPIAFVSCMTSDNIADFFLAVPIL